MLNLELYLLVGDQQHSICSTVSRLSQGPGDHVHLVIQLILVLSEFTLHPLNERSVLLIWHKGVRAAEPGLERPQRYCFHCLMEIVSIVFTPLCLAYDKVSPLLSEMVWANPVS